MGLLKDVLLTISYLGGAIFLPLGVILHIAGCATPAWSTHDGAINGTDCLGAFEACVTFNGTKTCDMIGDLDSISADTDHETVQAMALIGAIAGLIAILFEIGAIIAAFHNCVGKGALFLAAALNYGSCIFIIIGVIIWSAAVHDDLPGSYYLDYSFALSVVGGVFVGLGGIMLTLAYFFTDPVGWSAQENE